MPVGGWLLAGRTRQRNKMTSNTCGGVWLSVAQPTKLPWENNPHSDAPHAGTDSDKQPSWRQIRLAVRGLKGDARMRALLRQLQPPPQRPIALFQCGPAPTNVGGQTMARSGIVFEPQPYHFKIPRQSRMAAC